MTMNRAQNVLQEIFPAFEQNNIPVVLAASNCYVPYAGVYIQSMINHASEKYCYDIIIIEHDISLENKRLLSHMVSSHKNFSVRFLDSMCILEEWDLISACDKRWIPELFIRLFLPHFLGHYDRIISTGVDMLLKRDIAELFEMDLNGMYIGAVRDIIWQGHYALNLLFKCCENKMPVREYWEKELHTREPFDYVNSDLLVYDCKKFRQKWSIESIVAAVLRKKFMLLDQDAINTMMMDEIHFIDLAWNYMVPLNLNQNRCMVAAPEKIRCAYEYAGQAPALIHWSGKPKPWVCPDVPYGNEWWATAVRTPFMGHILSRMFDELQTRREYYRERYNQEVQVWNPSPNVDRGLDKIQ